jgi:hypothetical protein
MVDIFNKIIFDGSPLILPIMVGVSALSIYLVALAADRILNTYQRIRESGVKQVEVKPIIDKPVKKTKRKVVKK